MIEQDLLLDENGDLKISYGDLQLTGDENTVKQRIKLALLTFKGEWFLNEDLGIPYYQEILGQKNSLDSIKSIFIDAIQRIDGVKELQSLNIKLDDSSRNILIQFAVIDRNNNLIEMEL